jgi:hypothetical protein
VYVLAGVVVLLLYRRLDGAEASAHAAAAEPLGRSKRVVYRLAALFSLDAFGGGFVVQSMLALWLFRRFDLSVGAAGTLRRLGVSWPHGWRRASGSCARWCSPTSLPTAS